MQGLVHTFQYDGAGRISRTDTLVNNVPYSYQRWVYDLEGHICVYTTVQAGGQKTFSATVFGGMGMVRGTAADNPNSQGGYRGQYTKYDAMGRVSRQSNPTEIYMSATPWIVAGDDAAMGWVWTQQLYDWKGRPTVTTKADGMTKADSYGGCGCAGGQIVTFREEVGRYPRLNSDILGRPYKAEVLNWNQVHTVYSQYEADGSLRSAHDLLDERMDRAYSYDHAGKLQAAYSGSEARDYLNGTTSGFATGPLIVKPTS